MRTSGVSVCAWVIAGSLVGAALAVAEAPAPSEPDPYVARPRVVVMTDIANEPDDQMSLVRFLLYSNQFDVEGARRHHLDLDEGRRCVPT